MNGQVAMITHGHSDYDNRFYKVLKKYDDRITRCYSNEQISPNGLDYAGLFSVFMEAGAVIAKRSSHTYIIEVSNEDSFLKHVDYELKRHLDVLENTGRKKFTQEKLATSKQMEYVKDLNKAYSLAVEGKKQSFRFKNPVLSMDGAGECINSFLGIQAMIYFIHRDDFNDKMEKDFRKNFEIFSEQLNKHIHFKSNFDTFLNVMSKPIKKETTL